MAADRSHAPLFIRLRSNTPPYEWFVHPDLRARIVADADQAGSNLTDIATSILCGRFGIPFEPSGRRSNPAASDVLNLRIPLALQEALAREYGTRYMDGARRILCSHYGLFVPRRAPKPRRPRASVRVA